MFFGGGEWKYSVLLAHCEGTENIFAMFMQNQLATFAGGRQYSQLAIKIWNLHSKLVLSCKNEEKHIYLEFISQPSFPVESNRTLKEIKAANKKYLT